MSQHSETAAFLGQLDQLAPEQIQALADLCQTDGKLPSLVAPLRQMATERARSTSGC